ncbi:LPXTG cell wall anchor domain-containing protein [Micromonospora sp. NPDC048905]|uniref:LPXTG cell wall anchor domain-containing protein n=1 Tax=Micromonospora sp. NPDC048905 TaxID=3155494 RepID=UPI0033F3AD82
MGRTAANYLVGGALAAAASLALAVPPVLDADPASARGFAAVRVAPSADTGVTFEILPASPTPTPTQPASPTPTPTQPATPTPTQPTPAPPQPTPSHGQLPVTGSGGSTLLLVGLGVLLLIVGGLAARRWRRV